jgi:hypothetical protein
VGCRRRILAELPLRPGREPTQETDHATVTGGSDAVTTYAQPDPGSGLPHAVQQATTAAGTTPGASTFDDDADGNRLLTTNPDGSAVLTLPDAGQLTLAADHTTKTAMRYYSHNGGTVAVRDGSTVFYLFTDQQGTATTAVAALTLAVTRCKQLPLGQTRGTPSGTFPGNQGFVGGTTDPTGLTHLGAREYDPVLGRFAWANDRGMSAGYVYRNGRGVWQQSRKKTPNPAGSTPTTAPTRRTT